MPRPISFTKLTAQSAGASVERSLAFYIDVLGFTRGMTVPDASPSSLPRSRGAPWKSFLNDAAAAVRIPGVRRQAARATGRCYIDSTAPGRSDALHDRLKPQVKIVMPLADAFYGCGSSRSRIPDGYVITLRSGVLEKKLAIH